MIGDHAEIEEYYLDSSGQRSFCCFMSADEAWKHISECRLRDDSGQVARYLEAKRLGLVHG
jgi:hypothetical protein